jgi:hypothetical protein
MYFYFMLKVLDLCDTVSSAENSNSQYQGCSYSNWEARGSLVVKALHYKSEGRWFETRRGEFFQFI